MLQDKKDSIDGFVLEPVLGGESRATKFVRGSTVYEPVLGGPAQAVGYVKDGVAYTPVLGGPAIPIGGVKYFGRCKNL